MKIGVVMGLGLLREAQVHGRMVALGDHSGDFLVGNARGLKATAAGEEAVVLAGTKRQAAAELAVQRDLRLET